MGGLPMYGYNSQLSTLPVTPLTFASEHMGNEFTVISDFLESLGGDQPSMFSEQGMPVNVNTTEKFFLTAADPSDGTNEDRLTQVINAKFEAGFLKPYNYVNGYSRLQKYMDTNMSNISRQRILNVMGTFRPAFRSVAQSLTDIDLVLVEEAFERLLLDYDRVFSSMGIPACLWRRTGEIYKGNKEFAALVNVPLEMLREGRLCIYELMAEESAVNYWEKYGNIAFDAGQKAVLTSCLLKNPDPETQSGSV
ncbi:Transcription factor, partial [Linnemannia gamsii]